MKQIFITGGAGFIGRALALTLVSSGHHVTILDSLNPAVHPDSERAVRDLAEVGMKFILGDVRDGAALTKIVSSLDPQIIIHLAAETGTGQSYDLPVQYCDVNVMGTARLLEASRFAKSSGGQLQRVILAGSRSVYGEGAGRDIDGRLVTAVPRRPSDLAAFDFAPRDIQGRVVVPVPSAASSTHPAPASVYASTKLMQEHLLRQGLEQTGIECIILRLQNVYGAGQSLHNPYTGVLSIFARQLLDGRVLDIYEDGLITRDFVYVTDVVSAFHRACEMDWIGSQTLDIGSGREATIAEVAGMMVEELGLYDIRTRITGQFRPGDVRHAVADVSAARAHLNWMPVVELREGVAALITWAAAMRGRAE